MSRAKRRRVDGTGYAGKAARGERPFTYSNQYAEWRAAVAKGDDYRIAAADRDWARLHAPWRDHDFPELEAAA